MPRTMRRRRATPLSAMSHCLGLDRMTLSGGWAPGISEMQRDEL
jgi:hypothetical protein